MAYENIRSDHIGVLLEVYQKVKLNSVNLEKYLISKANGTYGETAPRRRI